MLFHPVTPLPPGHWIQDTDPGRVQGEDSFYIKQHPWNPTGGTIFAGNVLGYVAWRRDEDLEDKERPWDLEVAEPGPTREGLFTLPRGTPRGGFSQSENTRSQESRAQAAESSQAAPPAGRIPGGL